MNKTFSILAARVSSTVLSLFIVCIISVPSFGRADSTHCKNLECVADMGPSRRPPGGRGDIPPISTDWEGLKKAGRGLRHGLETGAKGVGRGLKYVFTTKKRRRDQREREETRRREERESLERYEAYKVASEQQLALERATAAEVAEKNERAHREEAAKQQQLKIAQREQEEAVKWRSLEAKRTQTKDAYDAAEHRLARTVVTLENDAATAVAKDPGVCINADLHENPWVDPHLREKLAVARGVSGQTFSSVPPKTFTAVATPGGVPFLTEPQSQAWPSLVAASDQYAVASRCVEVIADHRTEREALVETSGMLIHQADNYFVQGREILGFTSLDRALDLLDVAVDVGLALASPQLFVAKSVIELATGRNMITGAKLTGEQQVFHVLNAVFFGVGRGVNMVRQSGEFLQAVVANKSAGSRVAEKMLGYLELADQAARKERSWGNRARDLFVGAETTKYGAYLGGSVDRKIVEKVGSLTPSELMTAAHFGGMEGVLALRDTEVMSRISTWGIAQEGFNQAPAHLFGLNRKAAIARKRWATVERKVKLESGILTRALIGGADQAVFSPTHIDIKRALVALDDAANYIQVQASEVFVIGSREIYWLAPQSTSETSGLILMTVAKKKQTILPLKLKDLERLLAKLKGEPS